MIVVGATVAAFVMDQEETWGYWLRRAEELKGSHENVQFFCSIQVDARGLEPFAPLISRLDEVGAHYWTYSLDDGRTEVNSLNRIRHICFGRNLIVDYAVQHHASHILYLDADCNPPEDVIPKLLEVEHPLVAGFIPTYAITSELIPNQPFPLMDTWASAGCILASSEVFNRIRWRWNQFPYITDDPCYYADAKELLGIKMYVRKDVVTQHYPEHIGPIETRGHNMEVIR
jgi:hypothetical protein